VFWLFLSQVLSADRSCREALRGFLGWLALQGQSASPRTAGYCRARARLPQRELDATHAGLVGRIRAAHLARGLWYGRVVKVVDGSGLSMPDTAPNQKRYPQPKGAKKGCGFPVMRVVALFCLGTGVLIDLARGSLAVGERALFRSLWHRLDPGDVALADRGFCGYADLYLLAQRGADFVMRNHQRRTVGKSVVKSLGRGDRLILWHKSPRGPRWLDAAAWAALPETLALREITFQVAVKAFRARSITIVTSLLDPKAFPREAFPELYRRRWQAELYLRDIKIATGMDILRCRTPAMIHRELTLHLIAYNLVRLTMLEAAREHDVPVEHISFKGSLSTLRPWAPLFVAAGLRLRRALWARLLGYLAKDPLPFRPNRVEPRARKRRPKNYQLLTKPRHLFKGIPHRNRPRKTLS
jgi:hypothetical protein